MAGPSITVGIPTYNGAQYLGEAIASVLSQSYQDFEIVVSDDGSTDCSTAIARSFSDPRIRLDIHPRLGIGGNWNRVLELARGKWIKVMGQDDVLYADCLSVSVDLLERASEAVVVFGPRDVLHDTADPSATAWVARYGRLESPLEPLDWVNDGRCLVRRWVNHGLMANLVGEPVVAVFSTRAAVEVGGFDGRLLQSLDYMMWLRLFARGRVCYTPKTLSAFRYHAENASHRNRASGQLVRERLNFVEVLSEDEELRGLIPDIRLRRWMERLRVARTLVAQAGSGIGSR